MSIRILNPAGLVFLLFACTGPSPQVIQAKVISPTSVGGLTWVDIELENRGVGTGEVYLDVRIRERNQGFIIDQDKKIELKAHERLQLRVPIQAPPGDYEADVRSEYPIS